MFSSSASMGDSLSKIFLKFTHLSPSPLPVPSTSYLELCNSLLTASALALPTEWHFKNISQFTSLPCSKHITLKIQTPHFGLTWPGPASLSNLTSYLSHSNLCSSHLPSSQFLLPEMLCPSLAKMALSFQFEYHLLREVLPDYLIPKYFLQLVYVIERHPVYFLLIIFNFSVHLLIVALTH